MRFVYSPRYYADYGAHVFPIHKYRQVAAALRHAGIPETAFVEPGAATHTQLLRVHTLPYLHDLVNCRWTPRTQFSELPLTPAIVELFLLFCGGTICAAELALHDGVAVHIGGGFHHAFADKAEGFCYVNDLAVAIRALQAEHRIATAMVIDCDVHQGNGTAKLFEADDTVFTFSIHQENLYPVKQNSDVDIHLRDGVGDEEYLQHVRRAIPTMLEEFDPDLIVYQGGVDPYEHDQLGGLKLTMAGLRERDRLILQSAQDRGVPIAVTLGGGYAYDPADTVQLHVNTCLTAWATWQAGGKSA